MTFQLAGRRSYSSRKRNLRYIDKWFESIVKPQSFYEEHANSKVRRRYFYNVDLNGRLFLEETMPKNIASSIKDEKFLNFFFSSMRLANSDERKFLDDFGMSDEYPFVSPCGKEINYVRPACTPIVYHSFINGNLMYGGNIIEPFVENNLAISKTTGRLYHKLPSRISDRANGDKFYGTQLEYGLLKSSVAISMSEQILPSDDKSDEWKFLTSEGSESPIKWFLEDTKANVWAMPFDESNE